jgi:hypothetical protein
MSTADNASNVVQFDSVADAVGDLVERLVDATVRLAQLEQAQVAVADADDILARLAAFDARLTALEKRQRRPPPFPITVIETHVAHINPEQETKLADLFRREHQVDELSRGLDNEHHERKRADEDLFHSQQRQNGSMATVNKSVAEFNKRLALAADSIRAHEKSPQRHRGSHWPQARRWRS